MPGTSLDKLKGAAGVTRRPVTIAEQLESLKPQLLRVMNKNVNPDRLVRIVMTEIRKNPKLGDCDAQSLMGAVMASAQLHLEPGIFGQCYFVPYKTTCTFVTGWQGYVDLVSRSGRANAWTNAVREGDEFDCSFGSKPFVHHKPDLDGDEDRKLLYTYAIGKLAGSQTPVIEVWGKQRIDKHLKRYNKVGERHYALQNGHNFEMYARKIPLLQVVKYLPKSVELQTAAGLDAAAEMGAQHLTIDQAGNILEGDFLPELPSSPDVDPAVSQAWSALGYSREAGTADMNAYTGTDYLAHLGALIDQQNAGNA
jgi:recombination protein RecT